MRLKLDISMQSVFWITLCILLVQPGSRALVTLDLNGQWMVANTNRSHVISGTVPGSMYTALMANNVIGDPYFRENDGAYRWIGRDNWEYSRTFKVESSLLQRESVVLVCEGLDTVATILINNQTVGTSDNMFVRYIFNIKDRLVHRHENECTPRDLIIVAILTNSSVRDAAIVQDLHFRRVPKFPFLKNVEHLLRKDIYIQGYDTAAIRYVTAETLKNTDGSWRLNAEVFTEVMQGVTAGGTLELKLEGTSITRMVSVQFTSQISQKRFEIDIPKTTQIKEWWPNGHGNQTLYDLFVFYTDQHGMMTSQKVKVGFRTVEVVEDYVSVDKSKGKTFYFRINGRPVFFKGSNWIPADSFQERITRDYVYRLLKSAADVHMNVLRVWGGGVYESEDFYEIADELGIMIWQDFMFACAMYPTDTNFLQSVSKEVTHQVRRLKHHPSIVVLSGNNENEKALRQDWYGTNTNYTRYHTDYVQLYHDVIYKIVQQEDPNRIFLASSPSNGVKSGSEDWVAAEPWSTLYGDIHEYSYLVPFYDQSQYRIPRFSSEYGLQSYPSYETLKPVYHEDDMYYWGELNDWRNHHPFGNIELMAEAIQYVNLPNSPERLQKFKDQIYVTQITHAIGMKTETEHYRRWQNRLDDKGQGNTMGALYWMLADIWQAPTWASIEYGGKWKMLHYYAQHFFAPTLISPYLNGSDVIVYIVMDELPVKEDRLIGDHTLTFRPKSNPRPFNVFDWQSYYGTTFKGSEVRSIKENQNTDFAGNLFIDLYSWSSMTPLHSWKIPFKINSTAQSVYRENYNTMMSTAGCYRNEACFLYFHFGDLSGPTNWLPLSTFVSADGILPSDVKITRVTPTSTSDQFSVTITTSVISPFVWLEATGISGRFSDNGFLMVQPTMTLVYYAWETTSVQNLKESLKVMSLMDIYH